MLFCYPELWLLSINFYHKRKFFFQELQEKNSYKSKTFVFNLKDIFSISNSNLRVFLDKFHLIIQKELPWSTISISYPGESYQLQSITCQQDTNITGSGNQSKMCAIKKNITWRSENKFSVSNKLFRLTQVFRQVFQGTKLKTIFNSPSVFVL